MSAGWLITSAIAQSIGAQHDLLKLPPPGIPLWDPDDAPHSDSLDLNEYPVELLKMKKCRSFRADLRHKLVIIIRACGGYGRGGVKRAARQLKTHRGTLWKWLIGDAMPKTMLSFCRIDNCYSDAIEKLVAERVRKKRPGRKKR